jgi:hypothetical protein
MDAAEGEWVSTSGRLQRKEARWVAVLVLGQAAVAGGSLSEQEFDSKPSRVQWPVNMMR